MSVVRLYFLALLIACPVVLIAAPLLQPLQAQPGGPCVALLKAPSARGGAPLRVRIAISAPEMSEAGQVLAETRRLLDLVKAEPKERHRLKAFIRDLLRPKALGGKAPETGFPQSLKLIAQEAPMGMLMYLVSYNTLTPYVLEHHPIVTRIISLRAVENFDTDLRDYLWRLGYLNLPGVFLAHPTLPINFKKLRPKR